MAFIDSYGVEYSDDRKTLLKCPKTLSGSYTVSPMTNIIGRDAFKGCMLVDIIFSSSVKKIQYQAFCDCKMLNMIHFEGTLEDWLSIDMAYCINSGYYLYINGLMLNNIVIENIDSIKSNAFYYCNSLRHVVIKEGVKSIGDSAFNKTGLNGNIHLPNSIEKIGNYAFLSCKSLTSISIANTTDIGAGVFRYCDKLESIEIRGERNNALERSFYSNNGVLYIHEDWYIHDLGRHHDEILYHYPCGKTETVFTVPNNILSIEDYAFTGVKNTTIVFNKFVKIQKNTFLNADIKVQIPTGTMDQFYEGGYSLDFIEEVPESSDSTNNGSSNKCLNIISDNPFRVLGIPINASAKDLAANKGKMKLLDIGKEVSFPLDLPSLLPTLERSSEKVSLAEKNINLPNDKIHHSLFWFAKPSDTIGKFGYERLLAGDINDALDKLGKSNSWESQLCLATIHLVNRNYQEALSSISAVIETHSIEYVSAIAGQTYTTDVDSLLHDYLSAISLEVDTTNLYLKLVDTSISPNIVNILRNMAVSSPIAIIEKEIADAKAVNNNNVSAQLQAGRTLKSKTIAVLQQLKKTIGTNDIRYSRIADKLANQILQCSINYYNANQEETRAIINNALSLGEYAQKIAIGNIALDHIKHNLDILRKKLDNLPPESVEVDANIIWDAIREFVEKPDKIVFSETLLKNTTPHLQNIRAILGASNPFYLKLSTQVAANALHNLIEEVNNAQKDPYESSNSQFGFQTGPIYRPSYGPSPLSTPSVKTKILFDTFTAVNAACKCLTIMDSFDLESDFKANRYTPNRNTLLKMKSDLSEIISKIADRRGPSIPKPTTSSSGGCYIATMVYGDYDHPQVMVLRGFRDDVLQQYVLGRAFVRFYYKHSPTWVEHLKDKKGINNFIRKILDSFIKIYKHEK